MLRPIPAAFVSLILAASPTAATTAAEQLHGPRPRKVLAQWLALYRKGAIDVSGEKRQLRGRSVRNRAKDFVSVSSGLLSNSYLQHLTYLRELDLICKKVAEVGGEAAAGSLLDVAAIGLGKRKYEPGMVPEIVRATGEKYLWQLDDPVVPGCLAEIASSSSAKTVEKAAAMRVLGGFHDEQYRAVIEANLDDRNSEVRLAAATALLRLERATALPALADQLQRESDDAVRIELLDAMSAIVKKHHGEIAEKDLRRTASTALDVYGAHGWRVDLATLEFLALLRLPEIVPILIEGLAKYSGKLDDDQSRVVQSDSYDLLVSLTGAGFDRTDVDAWRAWWAKVAGDFVVANSKKSAADAGGTRGNSFFGIPVRGSRVVFVVDVSHSMRWDWDGKETKLAVAQRRLKVAVDGLPPDTTFNLVTFAYDANPWKKHLVPATPANKKSFDKYVDDLVTASYTNVWDGLEAALQIKVVSHGARYPTSIDEVFVLSDGAPTLGALSDPEHILATIRETNRASRVRINTVYIASEEEEERESKGGGHGPEWSMTGAELMQALAEQNGGKYLRPKPH